MGEDGIIALPGGGAIQAGGGNTLVVTWPCGSFVDRVAYWEGSHITVGFVPDTDMTNDGLVRFTERYMVPPQESPFRNPFSPENCEADKPNPFMPAEEEPVESPMNRLFQAVANKQ
uniref:hypothetical protein n=1 Tax=Roseovarius indicus TaxID=540747 RepID=UPI003B51A637